MQHFPFFYDLTHLGLIKITGSEAKKFLQGQLTCDMEKITLTQSSLAAHCNPQGRIISLFYIFLFGDNYYLLMRKNMVEICISALKKYAVFYKIQITDVSKEISSIGYLGPLPSELKELVELALINIPSTTERYIFAGKQNIINKILEKYSHVPIKSSQAWQCLNITDAIPSLYPETSGKFLPHEIHLHQLHAIDFQKGCYTGQEIIARMHYRGKLKNSLYKASIISSLPLLPGMDIYAIENQQLRASGIIVDVYQEQDKPSPVLIITDEVHAKNQTLCLSKEHKEFFTIYH